MGWPQFVGNPWKFSLGGRQLWACSATSLSRLFVGIPGASLSSTSHQSFPTLTQSAVRCHYSISSFSRSSLSLLHTSCRNSNFVPASSLTTKATTAIRTSTNTVHIQSLRTFNTSHQVGLRQSYTNFSFGSGLPHLRTYPTTLFIFPNTNALVFCLLPQMSNPRNFGEMLYIDHTSGLLLEEYLY